MTLLIAVLVAVLVDRRGRRRDGLARRSSKRAEARAGRRLGSTSWRRSSPAPGSRPRASCAGTASSATRGLDRPRRGAHPDARGGRHATDSDAALVWVAEPRRPAAGRDARADPGRGRAPGDRRPSERPQGPRDAGSATTYERGRDLAERRPDRSGLAVPMPLIPEASRADSRRLHPGRGGARRRRDRGARAARAARRPRDRERPALPGGQAAGRPRRAHRAAQPPLLPRDARARGRPRPPLQPRARARRLRPRRLQGDQRPDRPPRRGRRARRSAGACATSFAHADIACRVGGDEFAVVLPESTLGDAEQLYRRIQHAVSAQPIGEVGHIVFSAGMAELRRRTTRSRSSSGPTTRSTARRKPARARIVGASAG